MNIFYSHFAYTVAILFLVLGIYVYKVVDDQALKRIFLGLCTAIFFLLFFDGVIYSAPTKELCWKMNRFASIGYFSIPPLALHFFLRLTKRETWLKNKYLIALMYAPAVILIIRNYFNHVMVKDYVLQNGIWYAVDAVDSGFYWMYLSYVCIIAPGFISLLSWNRQSASKREKKQAQAIIYAVKLISFTVIVGKIVSPILDMNVISMPIFECMIALILMLSFWTSVVKYRLMHLTPGIAIEEILSKTKDLFLLMDLDGKINRINIHGESILNCTKGDLYGVEVSVLFPEGTAIERGHFEENCTSEMNMLRRDGSLIPMKLYFSTLSDELGDAVGYVIVGHDLTEKKLLEQEIETRQKTEAQLIASKEKYRLVVDNVNEGIIIIQDGDLKFINRRGASFLELNEHSILNMPASKVIHPDDLAWIRSHMEKNREQSNVVEKFSFRLVKPNDEVFWVENSSVWITWRGQPAILSFLSDITERKNAEAELEKYRIHLEDLVAERTERLKSVNALLQEDIQKRKQVEIELRSSEEKFREVFNNSREAILLIRPRTEEFSAKVVDMNETARLLLGDMKNENGETLLESYVPQDKKLFYRQAAIELLAGEKEIWETVVYSHSGEEIPVEINAHKFVLRDELVVLMVVRDITDRKLHEEKVLQYQEKLRSLAVEMTKVEEIERRQIATEIHDYIGQSLAVAKMKLFEVKSDLGQKSDTGGEARVTQAVELINTAIKYTRSLTFELSPPILYELGFKAAIEWLCDKMAEEHQLSIIVEDSTSSGESLGTELRVFAFKAIRELIFNVIKHADAKEVRISMKRAGDLIEISVTDDGSVFNLETTEMNLDNEMGFGLFSIKERLMQFDGNFSIESTVGTGTCVTIGIPALKNN